MSSTTFSKDFIVAYRLRQLKLSGGRKVNVKGTLRHPAAVTSTADTASNGESGSIGGGDSTHPVPNNGGSAGGGKPAPMPARTFIIPGDDEDEKDVQIKEEDINSEELNRPRRILSLDRGGVQGISSLLLLKDVIDKIKKEEEEKQRMKEPDTSTLINSTAGTSTVSKDVYPCEYFNLICGKSTGGLIAIMLRRLGMTVDNCIKKYRTMATRIFGSKSKKPDVLYDAEILQACFEEAIIKAGLKDDAKLDNRDAPIGCKTFVVATATLGNGAEPFLLRPYSADSQIPSPFDCTIVQACRATSAAPSFFDPVVIDGTTFGEKIIWEAARATSAAPTFFSPGVIEVDPSTQEIGLGYRAPLATKVSGVDKGQGLTLSDGGLTANNPTFEALLEAALRIPGWGKRLAAVVSIGTGQGIPPKLTRGQGFAYRILSWFSQWQALRLDIAKYCADLVTDTEATHVRVLQSLDIFNIKDTYFRLNAKDVGKFELDDLVNMPGMVTLTQTNINESPEQGKAREELPRFLSDPDYTRDHIMNERHKIPGVIPTDEVSFASSLQLQMMTRSMYDQDKTSTKLARNMIPWTWHVRDNGKPAMHSLIFYNYDEKTKGTWNHNGHVRRDQSILTDRRDEGESAIAVLELMSDASFVSFRFVKRWKIKMHDIPSILQAKKIMINGLETRCDKFVWLSFRCAGFGMKTQRTWFRVLDADDVEVMFGKEAFDRNAGRLN